MLLIACINTFLSLRLFFFLIWSWQWRSFRFGKHHHHLTLSNSNVFIVVVIVICLPSLFIYYYAQLCVLMCEWGEFFFSPIFFFRFDFHKCKYDICVSCVHFHIGSMPIATARVAARCDGNRKKKICNFLTKKSI